MRGSVLTVCSFGSVNACGVTALQKENRKEKEKYISESDEPDHYN
jgi:hypothetical protein